MGELEFLLQRDWRSQKLAELGTKNWVTVYHSTRSEEETITIYSALIPVDRAEEVLSTTDWEYQIGFGQPGMTVSYQDGERTETYEHFSRPDAIQPLVLVREFSGVYQDYTEILEEFRLFHNLYHDQKNNVLLQFTRDGYKEEVVRIDDNKIQIRLKWIKQFLAFKNMCLALYFDILRNSSLNLENTEIEEGNWDYRDTNIFYTFALREDNFSRKDIWQSLSILHGKKLIEPMPIEQTGIWPYEKTRLYESFLIGVDENGTDITFSCNPDLLSNYFGANAENPHYLTPVFFRRSVLSRYYSDPEKYEVNDGSITLKGYWILRADTNHTEYVIVFLGNLGGLPHSEQKYWRGQNVVPDGSMSEVYFRRSFLGEFADAENPVFQFKNSYKQLQKKWFSKFGWHLFKPLSEKEVYLFVSLHIPLNDNYSEFDSQILALTKTLIDSLNESEIKKLLTTSLEKNARSINKFEAYLKQEEVAGYEEVIQFMRQLQKIRSTSSAHRKGSNFEKRMKKIGIDLSSLSVEFERLIEQANNSLKISIPSPIMPRNHHEDEFGCH